jgi:hypothetical protein
MSSTDIPGHLFCLSTAGMPLQNTRCRCALRLNQLRTALQHANNRCALIGERLRNTMAIETLLLLKVTGNRMAYVPAPAAFVVLNRSKPSQAGSWLASLEICPTTSKPVQLESEELSRTSRRIM